MNAILQCFTDNKEAITTLGVLLTFGVSVFSLYFSVRNNKAVHYVDSVTKGRVEWIQKLKEYVSDFLKATVYMSNIRFNEEYNVEEHIGEIERIKSIIILHVNGDMDEKIIRILNNIQNGYVDLLYLNSFTQENWENKDKKEVFRCLEYVIKNDRLKDLLSCDMSPLLLSETTLLTKYNIINNNKEYFTKKVIERISLIEEMLEVQKDELIKVVRIYTKIEWNRVKKEAIGKKYTKTEKEKDLNILNELYGNN